MTASLLFQIANIFALLGWLVLAAGVVLKRPFWRDDIAGWLWPLGFSALYALLIVFFFFKAEGGLNSLADVQRLFTFEWAALAGWVHYLAFDLFVGASIARRLMDMGGSRLWLVALLPLSFMFGPIGFLGFEILRLCLRPSTSAH